MDVLIDDALPGDAAAIQSLVAQVMDASVTREAALAADLLANVAGNIDWWLAHPLEVVHLKAVVGGRIVGMVLVKQFWNLAALFVAPDRQGQGLGRQLVEAAARRCRGRSPKDALWLIAAPA
ncbi:MAG: GNAT family N-acetyltransferase, partial [Ramlibacter sp.]